LARGILASCWWTRRGPITAVPFSGFPKGNRNPIWFPPMGNMWMVFLRSINPPGAYRDN